MNGIQGPAVFLAQFVQDQKPFNSLTGMADWASSLGYRGVQIPTWDSRIFDLQRAAKSRDYCDEVKGILAEKNLVITELSTHLQGQLVAVHPAYDPLFDSFAPPEVHAAPTERQEWATQQLKWAAQASRRLGLNAHATFSGALAWPYIYPWPQRPAGLIEEAFAELARRWLPILDEFDGCGVDVAFELHPGEDIFDGATFERFLAELKHHLRCNILYDPSHFVLQQLDYLAFIDIYAERIKAFHVKDAEFLPSGKQGVYSGYMPWQQRAGRFRSLGDGQVDFKGVFSRLTAAGFSGWAVLEWECCLKSSAQGAREGAPFIRDCLIEVATHSFDDFAAAASDERTNQALLGLSLSVE